MSNSLLRKLAKSNRYQLLYNRAKELGTLRLFNNDNDLTKIQITFLYYLELYSSLYKDLGSREPYISEEVINDETRCDAYILWRSREKYKEQNKKSSKTNGRKKRIDTSSSIPSMIFHGKKE